MRCDYHPEEFEGGQVYTKRPLMCSNPLMVDFLSMYPAIMSCACISPECIDYRDSGCEGQPRFDSICS